MARKMLKGVPLVCSRRTRASSQVDTGDSGRDSGQEGGERVQTPVGGCSMNEAMRDVSFKDELDMESTMGVSNGAKAEEQAASLGVGFPTNLQIASMDAARQKQLEEALLLQMDMQKRLHDQLEVRGHLLL